MARGQMTARDLITNRYDSAQQLLQNAGLDEASKRRRSFEQSQQDFNNYLSSGNWTTENNQKYRDQATQAVRDLTQQQMRYGKNTNQYKQLEQYKNFYESTVPSLDRMDVFANVNGYIGNWTDKGYDSWHSEDDYKSQREYLDLKRGELQSQIDETEKKMKEKGELYSPDLDSMKQYMEMYDQLSDGLDQRHEWDKQFDTVDDYVAYQNSFDYDKVMQAEKSLAEKQAELEEKTARLSGLEAKFSQSGNTLGNALAAALGGDVSLMRQSSAMVDDPEGYQEMLDLQKEVAQLQSDLEAGQKDVDKYHEYQNFNVLQNYGKFDPSKNWEKEVDSLKEAYNKAEEGSVEQEKIGRQLTALAGSNWDGTDANGLFDEGNYLGRWYLQNIDVDADRKRYTELEDELKAMDASTTEGNALLRFLGEAATNIAHSGTSAGGGNYFNISGQNAAASQQVETAELESDPHVHELRDEKRQLNQNIQSAEKYQNRAGFDASYNALSDEQRTALIEAGKAAMAENGKSYTNGKGQSVDLKNFESILDDETDPELRDKIYAAIGAELTGAKLGYSTSDIVDAYSERLAQYAGYKRAKELNDIGWAPARWTAQVVGEQTMAGFNQFGTGVQQLFSDDAVEGNKRFYTDQATDQMIGENYGDPILNGRNFSQLLADTTQTTANMLPSILASSAVSYATKNPTAGAAVGAVLMGASSAGNAYQTALNEGWEKGDARIFAAITGGAEGGLQYLLGGIGKLGGISEEGLLQLAGRMNDAAVRAATKTAIHIGSETIEELIQNRIERYLRYKINGEDSNWMSWNEDDWYTVFVTALSTGALEGPGSIATEIRNTKTGNALAGNIIPSKGFTKKQQQWNASLKMAGELIGNDTAARESLLAFGRDTNLVEAGGQANRIAERIASGKMEANATNLGMLYSEIISEYAEEGKPGVQAAMAGVIGGAVQYNKNLDADTDLKAAQKTYDEVRAANKGAADVLDMNASKLVDLGAPQASAKEFAVLMNKIMSGTNLTEAEINKLLGDSTAAQAARVALGQDTNIHFSLTRGNVNAAQEIIRAQVKYYKDQKTALKQAKEAAIAEAQKAAVDGVVVGEAASKADPAGQQFGDPQDLVKASELKDLQKAESDVQAAEARVNAIKNADTQALGMGGMLEYADEERAGTVDAVIETQQLHDLREQKEALDDRAAKLSSIKFPSRAQSTELANIREETAGIQRQIDAINNARAERIVARAQAEEAKANAKAEPAQNSSGSADEVTLPNGTKMVRGEYVDNAVEQAKKENPNLSEEEIAKIREEANAEFDRIAEQTGGKVTEDGRRNESSASDEQRNDVGDTADGREDSQRTGETRSDVGRDATGRTELFAENSVNNAVYAGEGAVITSSEDSDALHEEYPELRGLNDSLKASGFTNIRYVTKGQLLAVVNRETGETRSVPALVRGTELLLRLDFNSPNYDYVATAEHERTHLQLGFLRDHLNVEETRAFVTSTLQNLLGQQAYENAFMKYWAQYGEAYYKNGQNDTTTVGHMINEEMFCDMVAGINEWGAGLGEFKGEIDEVLTDARFAEFTQALAEGEDPYASLIYEETESNALPYGLQVKETFDITDPFRNDVDRTKPPESRPLPGEEAMHEEQQLMSLQSMAEATGYELLTNDEGYPYGLKNKKTGELVTNVTPDMMVDTPIGNLITTAVGNGFISQNAANKEYKMLANVMNLILQNNAADLTWELVGSQLFSGIKKNSDTQYNWTIDFGTICRKTQDLIDAMSATMKKVGHGLTRREIEAVYLETGKAGAATPCPVCYVFSRWMGIGGLLDQINTFQDTYFTIQTDENGNFVSFDWAEGKSEQDLANFMNDIDAKIVAWAEDKQKADFFKDEKAEKKFARDNLNFGKILSDMKASPNRRQADAIKKINDSRQAQAAIAELEKRAESTTPEHAAKIRKAADSMREFVLSDDQIAALEQKLADAEEELAVFELYQWADRAVLERVPGELNEETGERELQWQLHPDYKPVPQSILFDLNKGADFAEGFARTWAFRTGKGNAMGKAIMPYSDARIGETIQGVASGGVKLLNEEMLNKLPEDDKKAVKAAMKNADILSGEKLNPFLNGKDKVRDKIMTKAIEAMRRQNLIGGMRLQSTSDFRFEWGSDYLITFFELQAIGANVQLYTKVIEAVDFLASMNADCNLSVMPLGLGYSIDPETNEAKLDFSSVTGINAEEAIKKAKQYDNVQLILVGINDTNIRLALAGTDVTFVIPFHGSGQSVDQVQTLVNLLGEDLDVQSAQDYSDVQDDHIDPRLSKEEAAKAKAMRALRMDIIQGKFWEKPSKKNKNKGRNKPLNDQQQALLAENPHLQRLYDMFYNERQAVDENGNPKFTQCMLNPDGTSAAYHCFLGKKQAEKIFPYEYWDTSLEYKDADQNGENFKSYCASLGIIPRFSGIDADGKTLDHGDFSNDPGYWKLLIDRKMYSNKYTTDENGNKVWVGYGKYRNQQKINASNIKIEDLDPQKATDRIPEKDSTGRNARTKALRPDLTEKIAENAVAAIEKMRSEGDIYDTKKISTEFRAARTQANKDAREAEQQMSLQEEDTLSSEPELVTAKDLKDKAYTGGFKTEEDWVNAVNQGTVDYEALQSRWESLTPERMRKLDADMVRYLDLVSPENSMPTSERVSEINAANFVKLIDLGLLSETEAEFMIRNLSEENLNRIQRFMLHDYLKNSYRAGYAAAERIFKNQIRARVNLKPHIGHDLEVEQYGTLGPADVRRMYNQLTSKTDTETNELAKKVFNWAVKMGKAGYAIPFKFKDLPSTANGDIVAGAHLGGKVRYDISYFNNPDIPDARKAHVLLHETIHAYSAYAINLVHMNDTITANPGTRYRGSYEISAAYSTLPQDVVEAVRTLDDIFAEIKDDPDFNGMYGTVNTAEMVAELSDPVFRAALKKKTLLQRILDAVKKLFGIDTTNAYDSVSAAFDKLMTSSYDPDIQNGVKFAYKAASKEYANFYQAEDNKQQKKRPVIPVKGGNNENAQMRFSQQKGENDGRENAAGEATEVHRLNQFLQKNNWARSYLQGAREKAPGVRARDLWRTTERRQRAIANGVADFLADHPLIGGQNVTEIFDYGTPDFIDYLFDQMAKDPEELWNWLNDNLQGSPEELIDIIDKGLKDIKAPKQFRPNYTPNDLDSEYLKAIRKDDTKTLARMVKEAAEASGFNKELFQHAAAHFPIFSRGEFGFHLGSESQAATFVQDSQTHINPDLFLHLYANIENPYMLPTVTKEKWNDDTNDWEEYESNDYGDWYVNRIASDLSEDWEFGPRSDELEAMATDSRAHTNKYNSSARKQLTDFLESENYDALQYTNDVEGKRGEQVKSPYVFYDEERDNLDAYILWDPAKLKSGDLITYETDPITGEEFIVPLSERFDRVNPEYRYSMQEEEITNPFPKDTLAGDLMNLALSGDVEAMNTWLNREMNKYNQKKEQAKIIPPRVPTREFVPKPTKEEMAAIEKKRLDQIGQYGAHKPSDQRVSDDYVLPKKDELGRGRSKFVQNVASASNVLDEPARDHAKRFAFTEDTAVYSVDENDADIKAAKEKIKNKGVDYCVQNFLENAEDMTWKDYANNSVTKVLAMGQQLLIETSTNGTYRDYLDVLSALTLLANQAGKSLQAFNMLKKSGPIGELYYIQKTVNHLNNKQYAKLIEAKKMSAITVDPDLEKAVVMAKTDEAREKAMNKLIASIAKQVPVTIIDKWNAWRHFAMLGNARTHVRNFFGNAIFMPLRFARDLLAATNETIAVKTGLMKEEDRTKSFTISRELRDFAKKDALVMKKELQGNGKYNPAQEILDARQIFAWRGLDKAVKWNGRMLEKEDWWFLAPAYQKALGMALMHSGFTVEELENSTEGQKALVRARRIAIEEAQRATYRDFSVAAAALNRLKRGGGMGGMLLEGVMPFTKTPINILKRGIEYSPVGIATALFGLAKDFHSGNINASQFIDRVSAGLTGTMLAVLGMVLAKAGWLRGKKDDKEEDFDKLQGYQDYSLQIGDVSMTIDWAAPGALPLFTGVAAWNMMQGEEELSPAMIWDAVLLIAEPMMSLSMLDGLNKTLSAASYAGENEKLVSIASTAFTSYIGQAFPTFGGQLARSIDGTRRQTYVDKNSPVPAGIQRFVQSSVQNKIPVWESQKAAYIDQWGREDTAKRKWLGALENFLSPSYINLVNTTDVDEEIGKLYEATKENDILPSSPTKKIGDKQLTADEYVAYAKDVGTTKYNMLAQLFSDPRYLALSDEDKVKAIGKVYHYANYAGRYHIEPTYDIRKNGGVWVQEAEAMPNDLLRYNRIWEAIAKSLED